MNLRSAPSALLLTSYFGPFLDLYADSRPHSIEIFDDSAPHFTTPLPIFERPFDLLIRLMRHRFWPGFWPGFWPDSWPPGNPVFWPPGNPVSCHSARSGGIPDIPESRDSGIPGSGHPGHPYRPLFKCGCGILTGGGPGGHLGKDSFSQKQLLGGNSEKTPKSFRKIDLFGSLFSGVFGCFRDSGQILAFWPEFRDFDQISWFWRDFDFSGRFLDEFWRFQELPKAPDLTFLTDLLEDPGFPLW